MADRYRTSDGRIFDSSNDAYDGQSQLQAQNHQAGLDRSSTPYFTDAEIRQGAATRSAKALANKRNFSIYMEKANNGDTDAMIWLGQYYHYDMGSMDPINWDYDNALYWYLKALEHGKNTYHFDHLMVGLQRIISDPGPGGNAQSVKQIYTKYKNLAKDKGIRTSASSGSNGLAIFLGIVCGLGIANTASWVYIQLSGVSYTSTLFNLAMLAVGFIISYFIWRFLRKPLILLPLAIAVFGFLTAFGIIPERIFTPKTSQTTAVAETTATVTSDSLNFRDAPNTNSNVIKSLKKGDTLIVTGETTKGWVPVRHGEDTGWVSAELVEVGK